MYTSSAVSSYVYVLLYLLICGLPRFAEGFNDTAAVISGASGLLNDVTTVTSTSNNNNAAIIDTSVGGGRGSGGDGNGRGSRLLMLERIERNPNTEDIRCFCNLPQCVTTSYMCRTARSGSGSGCFSEVREPTDSVPTRHGCVELLKNLDRQVQCDNIPRKHNIKSDGNTEMLLLCCQKDMCNHVDIPKNEMNSKIIDHSDLSIPGLLQTMNGDISNHGSHLIPPPGRSDNEDWFRVATIAVPICGAVIVFTLIVTAIKILRSERMTSSSLKLDSPNDFNRKFRLDHHHHHHSHYHHEAEQSMNKRSPHLIRICGSGGGAGGGCSGNCGTIGGICGNSQQSSTITIACDKKNETRAKINQLMNIEYSLLPQSCTDSLIKVNNLDTSSNLMNNKNMNISNLGPLCKNKDNFSKVYDKEVLSPITVTWGGENNLDNNTSSCTSPPTTKSLNM